MRNRRIVCTYIYTSKTARYTHCTYVKTNVESLKIPVKEFIFSEVAEFLANVSDIFCIFLLIWTHFLRKNVANFKPIVFSSNL